MASSYKVPQDVEAEDKLIGPFSFRQFIYLGVVAMALAACWGFFLLFPILAIIPLPIVIFFGALALPLRKDQPMETYLAAMWQFYIKPRRRMWMADGVVSRITIDIPTVIERQLTKNISGEQAISQFDYLSEIADTGGWSTRGVQHAPMAVVDTPEVDILDSTSSVAQQFDNRLERGDTQRREDLLARVHSGSIVEELASEVVPVAQVEYATPADIPMPDYGEPVVREDNYSYQEPAPVFDPTPKYMHQNILQPIDPNQPVIAPQPVEPLQPVQQIQPEPQYVQPPIVVQAQPVQAPVQPEQPYIEPAPQAYPEPVQNYAQIPEPVATPLNYDAIMELAKDVSVETVAKQLHHEQVERNGDEIIINLH